MGARHRPDRCRPGGPGAYQRGRLYRRSQRSDGSCTTWTPQTSMPT
ncbi:hypothetical protein HMPREF9057_01981 [Actinomyces sp. oral taxon 171 str. F0337]|nr:hypothetical protein HMPREF9057_01981 [Actinomyces sp. oral taxon 171 str. F0337]